MNSKYRPNLWLPVSCIGIPQTTVRTFMNHIPVHVGYTQGLSESQLGFGMLLGAIRTVCFLS